MNISARDETIYKMRKSGTPYAKIAKNFDISTERVRQIFFKVNDYKNNYDSLPPFQRLLSLKVQKTLIYYFNDEHVLASPDKIIARIKYSDLWRKVPMIGKKSVAEISHALITLGYIKANDKWFNE